MLQVIAGYDPKETISVQMRVPDYRAALRSKVSALRVGVARGFFFDGLDPEIEAAVNDALEVLQTLTAGLRDIALPAANLEQLRVVVRDAEANAYHAEFLERTPNLYQPETRMRLLAGAGVKTAAYIKGRREVELIRRTAGSVFEQVDVIVTPTTAIQPQLLAEVNKDVDTSMALSALSIRNTAPFNVFGWPAISLPCGFTRAGLPIGLQISGPSGEDGVVLRLAHAYEQATDWHTHGPPL
jgi:aspartyl-tRNA(Asn)/glutamyl-tRNA(Gln) amidotransferase subunit A